MHHSISRRVGGFWPFLSKARNLASVSNSTAMRKRSASLYLTIACRKWLATVRIAAYYVKQHWRKGMGGLLIYNFLGSVKRLPCR